MGFLIFSNLFFFISLLLIFIFLLFTVAFFTLAERKLMAAIQRRKGPDVVGFWGFLQPLADGLKLLFKEIIFPYRSLKFLFLFSPMLIFSVSLIIWIVLPLSTNLIFSSIYYSILFTFILASLNVYGLILSGWASNSRYAFLGSIRAAAQMISYELIFGIINLIIIFCCNSCNYIDVILIQKNNWFIFLLLPIFFFFLIIILAETNRTPFDLAEAEAELVAGYNLEYSSIIFALFFLGEYSNMLFLSVLGACYFFGGSFFFFESIVFMLIKVVLFTIFFIWIRATLPRYRYDQLMEIGWQILLPLIFSFFFFYIGIFLFFKLYLNNISFLSMLFIQFNLI